MNDLITPELLIAVIGSMAGAIFIVLWFFFQRLYTQNDRVNERLDNLTVMVGDLKKSNHEVEVRLNIRMDKLDSDQDTTRRDVSILYTKLAEMQGEIRLHHVKEKA